MKKYHRILAACLSVLLFVPTLVLPASAAAPGITTDESAYVNLDYYGKVQNVSVVKGCSLNGNTSFTDYGSYSKVTNMSGTTAPSVSDGSVSWTLPKNTSGRFYYECTPKDGNISLPWTFDVSYKLNGVPADASKLAGVSGLVEIDIHAAPNKNVSAYDKNNLLLQVGTAVKMKDTQSVDAPGAQVQALGEYKAVLFAALPGEEKDFAIRIGTTSFETTGVVMMMVPGTLSQFKDIKDLSKDKDTVRTSLDAVNAGTDRILNSLAGMSSGLSQTQAGLSALDGARGTISAGKGGVYKNADQALASLTDITNKTNAMIPHMKKAEQLVTDVNTDVNSLTYTVDTLKPRLAALSSDLSSLHTNVSNLRDTLGKLNNNSGDRTQSISELKTALKNVKNDLNAAKGDAQAVDGIAGSVTTNNKKLAQDMAALQKALMDVNTTNTSLKTPLSNLEQTILSNLGTAAQAGHTTTETQIILQAIDNMNQALLPYRTSLQQQLGSAADQQSNAASSGIALALESLAELIDASNKISGAAGTVADQVSGSSADLQSLLSGGQDALQMIDNYCSLLDDGYQDADKLMKNANVVSSDLQGLLDKSQILITNVDALNNTANQYKDGSVQALKDTESLTVSLTNGMTSTKTFLTSLEALLKTGGDQLNVGTQKSLNGLIQVLQKALDGIGDIPTIKDSNDTIKNTVDNEIDKIENKSNVMNLDYEAKPVSFTSAKNSTPSSIQIVLRTQEISKDTNNNAVKDAEKASVDPGPWVRIQNIFSSLWNSICSLFGKK